MTFAIALCLIVGILACAVVTATSDHERRSLQDPRNDLTVVVLLDEYPTEVEWTLMSEDGQTVLYTKSYDNEDRFRQRFDIVPQLVIGDVYRFQITDSFGDGILDNGYYAVYYGNNNVNENTQIFRHEFTTSIEERTFTFQSPVAVTTPSPTFPRGGGGGGSNTPAPTTCVNDPEGIGLWMRTEFPDRTRYHFQSEAAAFPTNSFCTRHRSYQACTNEVQEDCQWVFLNASTRKGVCRVDPVTKCLANGNCQCNTEDFHGGGPNLGNGILFHAPISVTPRDITQFSGFVTYREIYNTPPIQHPRHPQDDNFFISKADFTARQIQYQFVAASPLVQAQLQKTVSFKIHYLYRDVNIQGIVWSGLGLQVVVDTASPSVQVNERIYDVQPFKKWTCTHIAVTPSTLYVAGVAYPRNGEQTLNFAHSANLGSFSGELFDVRVYEGTLSADEVALVGARCANVNDAHALQMRRDIESPYLFRGCNPDFDLPGGEGGETPTDGKHTYGSGPFATLWLRPREHDFIPGQYIDTPEGAFDEEWYFQTNKVLQYIWEKFFFESGMMAFNQAPYKSWDNAEQVPQWSETLWDNPCRYLHHLNNAWQHPIWDGALPKWTALEFSDNPNAFFDLGDFYEARGGEWRGLMFVVHEMFHGTQGSMIPLYDTPGSLWMAESTAEYGSDIAFPGSEKILAGFTTSPAYPIGMDHERDGERGPHFLTEQVSLHNAVRGGHLYGSWVLWWFLAEHAGLPGIPGQMYSLWSEVNAYHNGEVLLARMLVESHNMDFGDVWSVLAAHIRTWDFPRFGAQYAQSESDDWALLVNNPDITPPIPRGTTLEDRKSQIELDGNTGTGGAFWAGPRDYRPGPNGWNCVTMRNVRAGQYVTVRVRWDNGMGFQPNTTPQWLPNQHAGCDNDARFYNNVVVAHNQDTNERRYWKIKGREPNPITIQTNGRTTFHILMVVTPPADYVVGIYTDRDTDANGRMFPIPIYSYQYSVQLTPFRPGGANMPPPAEKEFGIMKFNAATPGFWPVRCTCLSRPDNPFECIEATFDTPAGQTPIVTPSPTPNPTPPPTPSPTPDTPAPTRRPGGISFCFSGPMTVQTLDRGIVPMTEVQIGDDLLVSPDKYERVYSFGHYHTSLETEFIQLFYTGSTGKMESLELSLDHMVFLSNRRSVPASIVEVGDDLWMPSSVNGSARVVRKSTVVRRGVYAPFTPSGTVVVNGVVASNYVAFEPTSDVFVVGGRPVPFLTYQWMAHTFMVPHRIVCNVSSYLCTATEQYSAKEGISLWLYGPTKLLPLFLNLNQNVFGMVVLLLPTVVILVALHLLETMGWGLMILIGGLGMLLLHKTTRRPKPKLA